MDFKGAARNMGVISLFSRNFGSEKPSYGGFRNTDVIGFPLFCMSNFDTVAHHDLEYFMAMWSLGVAQIKPRLVWQ